MSEEFSDEVMARLFDRLMALRKEMNLSLAQFMAGCLAWFTTFCNETVPKQNRVLLLQKIAKEIGA